MAYATDSCILNGSANPNQYTPDTTTSTLQPVQGFTVTDGTNSGFCIGSAYLHYQLGGLVVARNSWFRREQKSHALLAG